MLHGSRKKTVQKLLSLLQTKSAVKKLSEYNELLQWLKVLSRKNFCFRQTNPWSYDQGNSESVSKYPKMGQSKVEFFGCYRAGKKKKTHLDLL